MERHLGERSLSAVFRGSASSPETEAAVSHLASCRRCWRLAAKVLDQVRRESKLAPSQAGSAVARIIQEEERHGVELLRARGWWAELKDLPRGEQSSRLRAVASLQTLQFFETLLDEARRHSLVDPHAAEQGALLAGDLAALLPRRSYPETLRNDLQAEALTVVANCRRLKADWPGALAAISEARELLKRGTGDPTREALLLSMHAALAGDTGNLEAALSLLARSISLYRSEKDLEGIAWTATQEAGTLLAADRAEEACNRAEEVLSLPCLGRRMEMLARSIIIEGLVLLDRTREALHRFLETRQLYEEFPEDAPRVGYLAARLLDALGHVREAERIFRDVAQKNLDAEHYKEAFLTFLTLFESHFKRGALDKAAKLCEEVLSLPELVSCRAQVRQAWQELLTLVRSRALELPQLLALRQFHVRYWSVPAPHGAFALTSAVQPLSEALAVRELPSTEGEPQEVLPPATPAPEIVGELDADAYYGALDHYEGELFKAVVSACNYSVSRTARVLRMSRNTVKAKMKKFGLYVTEG